MKFGQLIEYSKLNIFFESHAGNEPASIVPDLLFFKKALNEVKVSGQQLSFNLFW